MRVLWSKKEGDLIGVGAVIAMELGDFLIGYFFRYVNLSNFLRDRQLGND